MTEDVTAVEMVDQAHRQLDSVSSRFSFVEALHDELEKRTLGKPFIARNACMWEAMLSARDMAVVHFGQWVVTTHNQGLMKQLDRCSLRGFYVPGQLSKSARDTGEVVNLGDPADGDTLRESIRQHKHAGLLKLYHSMFPSAAIGDREPNRSDVDDLRECFWTELECVKDDRNNHRAHPPYGVKPRPPKAKMLDFGEIRGRLEWAHEFLKNMRLLLDRTGRGRLDRDRAAMGTAADVADIILFGSKRVFDRMAGISAGTLRGDGKHAWQYRDALYAELWRERPDSPFSADLLPETEGHRAVWSLAATARDVSDE